MGLRKLDDYAVVGDGQLVDRRDIEPEFEGVRPATKSNVSAMMLAKYLDEDAENANYHGIVGKHEELVGILHKHVNSVAVLGIMLDLWARGGFVPE